MAWSSIAAPITGAVISLTNFGLKVIANLNYLFQERPVVHLAYVGAANKTTTSTTFVAVDATNLRLTATINSGRCMIDVSCEWAVTFPNAVFADILLDGGSIRATNGGASGVIGWENPNVNSDRCSFHAYFSGLSVGSHTFDLAWKVSAGTGTIYNNGIPVSMILIEC